MAAGQSRNISRSITQGATRPRSTRWGATRWGTIGPLCTVGSFSGYCTGCGCAWFCARVRAAQGCADFLGAGSHVCAGIRCALYAGPAGAADYSCQCLAGDRCALGDGGGVTVGVSLHGDRGNMGRSGGADLHRVQAPCVSGGGAEDAMLADPTGSRAESQFGPQPVARLVIALTAPSARQPGTGCAAMACRIVPLPPDAGRNMDSAL